MFIFENLFNIKKYIDKLELITVNVNLILEIRYAYQDI